jgi:hypothetical protein
VSVQRDTGGSATTGQRAESAPQELQALGLSEDGELLVLGSVDGQRFAVPLDERLRSIVRGRAGRLGQQEVRLESALSPREMQARMRAGASAADVARAAGIPIERVAPYEGPVLAERARVVDEARAARLPSRTDDPRRPLGELVDDRLATSGVAVHEAEWDAWRRPDGTWMVHVTFTTGDRERRATWSWDPSVRRVRPHDEDAEALVAPITARPSVDLTGQPSQVELALVPEPDEEPVPALTEPPDASVPAGQDASEASTGATEAESAQAKSAARKGRPAVPSWDDIVFGTRRG